MGGILTTYVRPGSPSSKYGDTWDPSDLFISYEKLPIQI